MVSKQSLVSGGRMTERIFNFSAGPAVLPLPVLEEAQRDMLALPGVGMSVMEISHRSKTFDEIFKRAESGIRDLLGVPDNYQVLFLQGGASLQFSMVAMNLLAEHASADYVITGSWGKKALKEAKRSVPRRSRRRCGCGFTGFPPITSWLWSTLPCSHIPMKPLKAWNGNQAKCRRCFTRGRCFVRHSVHTIPWRIRSHLAGAQKNMGTQRVTP